MAAVKRILTFVVTTHYPISGPLPPMTVFVLSRQGLGKDSMKLLKLKPLNDDLLFLPHIRNNIS